MVSVRPLWRPRNCSQADYLKEQASKNFSNKQRGAWERAIFLRPSILEEDSSFLLMFLRGRRFHIPMAAQSILQFFDGKSKAFRDDLLTQRVTWQDVSSCV